MKKIISLLILSSSVLVIGASTIDTKQIDVLKTIDGKKYFSAAKCKKINSHFPKIKCIPSKKFVGLFELPPEAVKLIHESKAKFIDPKLKQIQMRHTMVPKPKVAAANPVKKVQTDTAKKQKPRQKWIRNLMAKNKDRIAKYRAAQKVKAEAEKKAKEKKKVEEEKKGKKKT